MSRCDTSGELGSPRSRLTVALEKISSSTSSTTWTMVFVKESIAPDVIAIAGATPWRWKNRTLTARRAMLEGSARFM